MSEGSDNYRIAKGNVAFVAEICSAFVAQGWIPLGSPFETGMFVVAKDPETGQVSRDMQDVEREFAQAMWKPEK